MTPEELGRTVRRAWIDYCIETGRTDEYHRICPWEELDEWSKEVDRRIGVAVYDVVRRACELGEVEMGDE